MYDVMFPLAGFVLFAASIIVSIFALNSGHRDRG